MPFPQDEDRDKFDNDNRDKLDEDRDKFDNDNRDKLNEDRDKFDNDDLEIENQYDLDYDQVRLDDDFLVDNNKGDDSTGLEQERKKNVSKQREDDVSGINGDELRKKIENFKLKREDEEYQDSLEDKIEPSSVQPDRTLDSSEDIGDIEKLRSLDLSKDEAEKELQKRREERKLLEQKLQRSKLEKEIVKQQVEEEVLEKELIKKQTQEELAERTREIGLIKKQEEEKIAREKQRVALEKKKLKEKIAEKRKKIEFARKRAEQGLLEKELLRQEAEQELARKQEEKRLLEEEIKKQELLEQELLKRKEARELEKKQAREVLNRKKERRRLLEEEIRQRGLEKDKLEEEIQEVDISEDYLKRVDLKYKRDKAFKKGETLKWYIKTSRWPIIFIVLFNLSILFIGYFASISFKFTDLAAKLSWLSNFRWPFEIIVFLLVSYLIVKKRQQLPRIAGFTCAFIGFSSGVIIAVVKLFWYREMWNIFYLSLEGIFLALTGFIIGLLSSAIFYEGSRRSF